MNLSELLQPIEAATPPKTRAAVLWGPESLFLEAVEFFLKDSGWQVTKVSSDWGAEHLIEQVRSLIPDVVILCQEREFEDSQLLAQLGQLSTCTKVVVLNMESNFMKVYARRNVMLHGVSDLLSVVDHDFFSNSQFEEVHTYKCVQK